MRFKITALIILSAMIFFSCKKEEMTPAGVKTQNQYVPRLRKILTNSNISNEYVYNDSDFVEQQKSNFDFIKNQFDGSGKLIKSEYYGNDVLLSNSAMTSSQAPLLTLTTSKLEGTIIYDYNGSGQLVKATTNHASLTCSEYSLFTYDSNNRINKQTMFWDDAETGYIDYAYDVKGNLTTEMLYKFNSSGTAELFTTSKYTYDINKNPLIGFHKLMMPGVYTNTNNIIKETYTMHVSYDQSQDKVVLTENTYTYNPLGYPVSKNGNVTYIYQ